MINSQRILEQMCRACMCKNQTFHSLCEEATGTRFTIYEMVASTIPQVPIHSNDELPKKICVACLNTLIVVHKFQQMCIASDTCMRSLLVSNRLASHSTTNSNTTEKQDINHLVITQQTEEFNISLETQSLLKSTCSIKVEKNDEAVSESIILKPPEEYQDNDALGPEWSDGDDIPLKKCNLKLNPLVTEEFQSCMKYEVNDAEVQECGLNGIKTKIVLLESNEAHDENEFTTESGADNKRRTISVPCPECGKMFDRYSLSRHMNKHNPTGKPFVCIKCNYRFATRALLKRHEVTHNVDWAEANEAADFNPEGYKCNDCPKRFAKRESLSAHLQSHKKSKVIKETSKKTGYATSTTMFSCILCPKQFQKHKQLKRHSRTHADKNKFECNLCDKTYSSNANLQNHLNKHNGVKASYACKYCSKSFQQSRTLKDHIRIHTGEQFECNLCDKTYSSNANLQDHLNKHNGVKASYACKYCSKSFQQPRTLKDHIRIHTGEQPPYLCSECSRAFNSLSNLNEHLLRHANVRRYECPECPKKFRCRSDLVSHTAVHKKNPHICDVCGATFGKPFHLKKHKENHNGDKPHKCEYCDMRFVCVDRMRLHMRTHTGEKPYKCKYCESAFALSNSLVKHLRSHIGENLYECELCPKTFRLAAELREHLSLHKNDDEMRT